MSTNTHTAADWAVVANRAGERVYLSYRVDYPTMQKILTVHFTPVPLSEPSAERVARLALGDDTLTEIRFEVMDRRAA